MVTAPADRRWYAVKDPASPRFRAWVAIFGRDFVEVESPEPHMAVIDGDALAPCVKAKLSAFAEDELQKLLLHMAEGWGLPYAEVAADLLGEHGLPIRADEVEICTDPAEGRARWAERRAAS